MDAKKYFIELEYRICREIDKLRGVEFHGLWCDGIHPESFESGVERSVVSGRVWMGRGGRRQEKWRFEFLLPAKTRNLDAVDWAEIFPPEDFSGWLELHQSERFMRINPRAAPAEP